MKIQTDDTKTFYSFVLLVTLIFMAVTIGINIIGYAVISMRLDNVIAGQALIDEHLITPKKFVIYYDPASDNKVELTMKEIEPKEKNND